MKKLLLGIIGLFSINTISAQYCVPSLSCASADFINNFSTTGGVQNITNNNTGCNGQPGSYIFYSAQTVSQIQGLSVNFSVQSGTTWSQGFRIWVDWNQDGDFADPGEDVYASPNSATTPFTGIINVPFSATPGITRMRVLCRFATVPANNPCDNSNGFGEIEDYNFDVVASAPCVAPPTAGTTISSQDSICPNVLFNLSLSGASTGSGLSYQWLSSSTSTGPWIPITGATNASYAASQTAATFYRCIVTCSSQDDTSTVKLVTMRSLFGCYCPSNATSTANSKIDSVYFNTIVTGSLASTCQTYTNFIATHNTTVIKGQSYPIRVRAGTCGSNLTRFGKVYIDYNQDGVFQAPAEEAFTFGPTTTAQQNFNGLITIPLAAISGATMMRVVLTETGSLANVNPCGTYSWGETEDYRITIIDQPAIDINVRAMTSPTLPPNCYTNCEPVNVRLRNDGLNSIDFSVDPMTVSVNVTGANPQLLTTTVNTGTLSVGDSMFVTVDSCYNMSAFGTYNFRPYANIATDGNVQNDSLNIITINNNNSAGTASISANQVCLGNNVLLTLSGNSGTFQWESSNDGGNTWIPISGATTSPYSFAPTQDLLFRAVVCNSLFSNIVSVIVHAPVPPTVINDTVCGLGTVILQASGSGTLQWFNTPTGGTIINTGNTYSLFVNTTSTFYVQSVIGAPNCASTRTAVNAVVTTTPPINISISNDTICAGQTTSLVVSSSNTNYSYTWNPSGILNTSTGSSVIAQPTQDVYISCFAIDNNNCATTDSVFVKFIAVQAVDAFANRTSICGNDTTMLMSSVVGGAIQNFVIGTGTVTNSSTSYPAPYGNWFWGARHQFLVTAAEMIAAGASAGPLVNMSFNVTALNTNPALQNFTIRMGHTTATNMTAWVTTPPLTTVFTAPTYLPTLGLNVHTFNTPFVWDGVSNIVIETCFNNSSWTNNCSFSQSTTSFVSSRWFIADAAGVCSNTGQSGTSSQRPNIRFQRLNTYSYAWTPTFSVTNATTQNTIATPNGLTTNYIVTLIDSATGCTSSDSVLITANPVPQPNLGPNINVCSGQQFVLTPGSNFNTYQWNTGSIGQLIIVNGISTPQTYWVDVTNSFGCSNRDSIIVSVNPSPNINLGNDTTICKNHILTLNAGSGFTSYQWNTGATTPSITIPQGSITSVYYVTVTNSFGCTDTDTILVTVAACTGIEELDGSEGTVLLYPNPSRGLFNLVVDIPGAENAQVEIINAQGRAVYNASINNTAGYKELIDLSGNASGIYYVRVISEKYTNISKLMINN